MLLRFCSILKNLNFHIYLLSTKTPFRSRNSVKLHNIWKFPWKWKQWKDRAKNPRVFNSFKFLGQRMLSANNKEHGSSKSSLCWVSVTQQSGFIFTEQAVFDMNWSSIFGLPSSREKNVPVLNALEQQRLKQIESLRTFHPRYKFNNYLRVIE